MTDTYIPWGSSSGDNFKQVHEVLVEGQKIYADVTGSKNGLPTVIVTTDPVSITEPVAPTPLGSPRTFLMEDAYSGGYSQALTEANAASPGSAASMTWVLGRGNYFPQTASNGEVITLENELDSQAKADAWAEVWTAWALDNLAKKEAAGLTVAGNPICLDPEDKGVDSAVGAADWNFAKTANSTINAGGYSDTTRGINYTTSDGANFATDITVAMPFILSALTQVTEAVKAAYPTSPVGWYNAGFLVYLPGWQGADTNTTDGTWAHFENVLSGLVTEDSDYFQHEFLDLCDFGFVPWYQGVGNTVEDNLDNGNDNNVTSRSWMGYFNDPNSQARALYLVLKYLGPNSVEGSGATKGDKIIFGLIESYMAEDGDAKNLDGGKAIAVRAALSAVSGGTFAQVAAGPNAQGATTPANWVASDLGYTDLSLLRGSSTLLGTDIPNPGDSSSDTSDPGVYNVPYLKEEFLDYMSWLFSADSNNMVNADGDLLEYGACPTDPFRNLTGSSVPSVRLTDTMADMRMSIFDGDMATEYSYTPSGGGSNNVYYIAGRWAANDMGAMSAARQVQVLYSGYGNHKDYANAVPGQTASDIFPASDKAAWFDVDKKERALAMINREVDNFLAAPSSSSDIFDIDFTAMTSSGDAYVDGSTTAAIPGTSLTFQNWGVSTNTVWKVGNGGTSGAEPYKSTVHLYKSANGSNQFNDGIVTDVGTLSAFVMEGVIAEGGTNDSADYGFLVACDLSGSNVIRGGIINGSENSLKLRTKTDGGSYVDTVVAIQAINSADRQFMRTTFDGTTITVEAWDGTDDTGTKLGTVTRDVTGLNMGTYFGFLGGKGVASNTAGRSVFSMKLTDNS